MIGRNENNQIVLNDPSVSAYHAELRCENGGYALLDLNSTNGLWVRDSREQKITLEPGVPVTIGQIFTIELAGAPVSEPRGLQPAAGAPGGSTADTLPANAKRSPSKAPDNPGAAVRPRAPAAKPPAAKAGVPQAPGLIAALARMPKPMLFGGFAVFVIFIMAL